MSLRNLLQKFGVWTTVMKWNEPWSYRVKLKGDFVARLSIALAAGSLMTTLLLVLFAINVNPPHPLFAFIGMALIGGLALMFLVHGNSTAGGRVRVCQEGICRKRMYAGLSAQWAEEMSWPYGNLTQCAIVPAPAINRTFYVLLLSDGSDVDMIGVPNKVDLNQLAQLFASKGVAVHRDELLPPKFTRPMNLAASLLTGAMSLVVLLGGVGFYALRVTFGPGH